MDVNFASLALIAIFLLIVLLCVKPLGSYIADVMEGRPIWVVRLGTPIERLIYRICGIGAQTEMAAESRAHRCGQVAYRCLARR